MARSPKAGTIRRAQHQRTFAQMLRAKPTDAERGLWLQLRSKSSASCVFAASNPSALTSSTFSVLLADL